MLKDIFGSLGFVIVGSDILFWAYFFDMNIAHESKSNKTPLYLIGELIGVPNTVMDSALHELKDRIDKDPKYKDVKNWLESLPKI